jgi:hypothetical protein
MQFMGWEKVIHIRRLSAAQAARVLMAALPNATESERFVFIRELLSIDDPTAIRAGLTALRDLRPHDQKRALAQPLAPPIILRHLAGGDDLDADQCDALLYLIERQGDVRWLPLLTDLLINTRAADVDRAAACMLAIVIDRCGPHGLHAIAPAERDLIDRAASRALRGWRAHRAADVALLGAILAQHPGPVLRDLLGEPDADCLTALRSTLSQTGQALVRRNLLRWLTHPQLGRAALRRLNGMADRDAGAWDDVLSQGHLLRLPAFRRALRQVDRPARCIPRPGVWARLSPTSQRWLPTYLAALGLTPRLRRQSLMQCMSLPHPTGRMALLRVLDEIGHGARDAVAHLLVRDRDARVARVAAAMLIAQVPHDPTVAALLASSPHASVRRMAARSARRQAHAIHRTMDAGHAPSPLVVESGVTPRMMPAPMTVV